MKHDNKAFINVSFLFLQMDERQSIDAEAPGYRNQDKFEIHPSLLWHNEGKCRTSSSEMILKWIRSKDKSSKKGMKFLLTALFSTAITDVTRQWSNSVKQLKTKNNSQARTVDTEKLYFKNKCIIKKCSFFPPIELTMYKQNSRQYTLRRKGYAEG